VQTQRVTAWIPVLGLLLDGRYDDRITDERRVLFVSAAADAIERRLVKPGGPIDSQGIGPANVKYNSRAALSRWFEPEEIAQLDEACGIGGGIRSVRAPAPDAIRFGNSDRGYVAVIGEAGLILEED
jgi:hypothetical protein